MTYRNRNLSSIPDWQDGDVCEMSNFASYEWRDIDNGKKVTFINCNLLGCKTTLEQLSNGNLIGEPLQSIVETPPIYPELAANAEIVLNALKGSGKLTPEKIVELEQLAAMAKAVSGTDAELGQIATEKTIEMINILHTIEGCNELADMMQQALQQIQAGWEV